jgi:hypothetical protein
MPLQPYSSNPSFRPPPPLSNDLQNILYAELSRGNKTVGQLAEQFSVSKARIEAVRKLKEVEREFKRQVSGHSAVPVSVFCFRMRHL